MAQYGESGWRWLLLTLSNPEPLKFLKGCNVVISENGCNSMGYDYFPYASDSYLLSWDCQIKL